jgi:hypothetical protein
MIYIITACSRPQNLEKISKTIPKECSWIVVYDDRVNIPHIANATFLKCDNTGKWGVRAQNFALDTLPLNDSDFVQLLDDDNLIHPEWYSTIQNVLDKDFSILTWGQLTKHNKINMIPTENPKVGDIDTGNFLISWKYNKHVRHINDRWEHDGIYANECAKNGPVLCIQKFIAYYNYLR